jgi:myo-inositol-1(or 4)-monophosphatase
MSDRYDFVVALVREAGERVLMAREREVTISLKENNPRNIVTNVDLEVSDFISEKIREKFPNEVIFSEEADADTSSKTFWAIDPIDGTAPFTRGIPHYSVVLAYVNSGEPEVGAIYNPVTAELFSFEKGKGAYLNGKQVKVSAVTDLDKAHIFFRAGSKKELWDWGASTYRFLLEHANKTANFGSSALDMCFVGAGRIEASIYGVLTPIDIAAASGFVKEAGGLIVGKGGQALDVLSKERQTVVAVNNSKILEALKNGISI